MIAGKWPIQGVWGDLLSRVAGMWYLSANAPPTPPPPISPSMKGWILPYDPTPKLGSNI